ncbi:hypothetical protein [Sporichthya polymorpha]|uniref:hypothetical protein n=1 Tax=Sporichthya polymorpha TaxID=35751 RepID=UPI001B7FB611|nr:hypothetical protein [Sporichthya polymorpha]
MERAVQLGRTAADAGSTALAAVFGTVAKVRPAPKPLHPAGTQVPGTLRRWGSRRAWGVPWVDEAGEDRVLVRFSRATGLPDPLPDILGLTIRVQRPDGPADLLLATTGTGVLTKFTLLPRRDPGADYGTLMAYRTPTGPLWLFARGDGRGPFPRRITLSAADARGGVAPFGEIVLDAEPDPTDPVISFDPVENPLPGLEFYPWEQRLREGAYAAARSVRGRERSG